ncbi:hypothetical protein R5R35_004957 [Gryllus longicercus]|uniref:Uncharacterized protein n=1 Tax=Gryllus longicercus TaxID=2509291 RepID=A0AAN9VHF2_9ORTH
MAIYTNRPVARRKGAIDGPHLHFQHEDLLRTGDSASPNTVFSFGYGDHEVWKLYNNDPLEDIYQHEFLPRLRVFSDQAHVNDLTDLIKRELDTMFGAPMTQIETLLPCYVATVKKWALVDTRGAPLTESSGEVESLVAEELAKQGRAAAGGGALRFQAEHCVALRRALGGSQRSVAVRVRGVPAGHRAAKAVQVLDEAFAGRWAYVGDRQLRELPRAALEAACGAGHVQLLLLDAEEEVAAARALVAAVGCSVKVVAVSSDHGAGPLRGDVTIHEEEDWRMDHLTLEAQEAILARTLQFQIGT